MREIAGVIRSYDWGDRDAIASILGHEAPGTPEAEYWLGAHRSAPSVVVSSGEPLDAVIQAGEATVVGQPVWERFGQLPFLLKILAADCPLSIQAHPSLAQAKAGFAREDAAGIDRAAPNRNYRDDNHKPELICAITPFEAKCGFRQPADTVELLALFTGPHVETLRGLLQPPAGERPSGERPSGERQDVLADAVRWLLQLSLIHI